MGGLNPQQTLALYTAANPFDSANALRFSNYSAFVDGTLVRLLDWRKPSSPARMTDNAMRAFLLSDGFSCVAGKAAVLTGGYRFGYYTGGAANGTVEGLARDLAAFVAERNAMPARYATFVAAFDEPSISEERRFESWLWATLQRLHELDAPHHDWDASVSHDPASDNFGFSFAGKAFFVVGLHGGSSRLTRRFFLPALVFNAHSQFQEARRSGRFAQIQRAVRGRELASQGSLNPELAEFGTASEARQYAGRRLEGEWTCPFKASR